MITRNLTHRLERLEGQIMPVTVSRVWQIMIVDSGGVVEEEPKIEWKAPMPIQRHRGARWRSYRF
jgi:hypothetical protein